MIRLVFFIHLARSNAAKLFAPGNVFDSQVCWKGLDRNLLYQFVQLPNTINAIAPMKKPVLRSTNKLLHHLTESQAFAPNSHPSRMKRLLFPETMRRII